MSRSIAYKVNPEPTAILQNLYDTLLDQPGQFTSKLSQLENHSLNEDEHDSLLAIITKLCELSNANHRYVDHFKQFIPKINIAALSANLHKDYFHAVLGFRSEGGEKSAIIPIIFAMVQAGFDPGVMVNGENALSISVQQSQPLISSRAEVLSSIEESRSNAVRTIDETLKQHLIADAKASQIFLRSGKITEFEGSKGFNAAKDIEGFLAEENYSDLRNYLGERFYRREYKNSKETADIAVVDRRLLEGNATAGNFAKGKRDMARLLMGTNNTPDDTPRDANGNYSQNQTNTLLDQNNEQPSRHNVTNTTGTSLIARLCSWISLGRN